MDDTGTILKSAAVGWTIYIDLLDLICFSAIGIQTLCPYLEQTKNKIFVLAHFSMKSILFD